MAFDIADIVDVSATVLAAPVAGTRKKALVVGNTNVLPATGSGRVKEYTNLKQVGDDFNGASEEYLAATAYFAQENPPPPPLYIARWSNAGTSTSLNGGDGVGAASTFTEADYSFRIGGHNITGLDFSALTTMAAISSAIQTKLRTLANTDSRFANAATSYDGSGPSISLTLPSGADVGYATAATPATGTDLAPLIRWTSATAQSYVAGSGGGTLTDALNNILEHKTDFYAVCLTKNLQDTTNPPLLATWAKANRKMAIIGTAEAGAVSSADTTSAASVISASENSRAVILYSKQSDYKHVALAAAVAGVNFNQRGSFRTYKFLPLTGFGADEITSAERTVLLDKRINYYAQYGRVAMLADGVTTKSPIWIDVQAWLDWLVEETRVLLWGLLLTRSIRMTSAGLLTLRAGINGMMERAYQTGGIAPGRVSPTMRQQIASVIEDPDFDGFLSNGYLVNVPSANSLTQAQRDQRTLPPIQVWLKGSSLVHDANVSLTFEN